MCGGKSQKCGLAGRTSPILLTTDLIYDPDKVGRFLNAAVQPPNEDPPREDYRFPSLGVLVHPFFQRFQVWGGTLGGLIRLAAY